MRASPVRLACALSACLAAPAQASDPEVAARFIDLVRGAGCSLAATDVESDLAAADVSTYALSQILPPLMQADLIAYSIGYERVILDEALCAAPPTEDAATFAAALAAFDPDAPNDPRQVIDVAVLEDYEPEFIGLMIMAYAAETGCAIDITDRDVTVTGIVAWLAAIIAGTDTDPTLRSDVAALLAERVGAELDGPPEGFTAEPGRLVLQDC
jgi:hypothetical protein